MLRLHGSLLRNVFLFCVFLFCALLEVEHKAFINTPSSYDYYSFFKTDCFQAKTGKETNLTSVMNAVKNNTRCKSCQLM